MYKQVRNIYTIKKSPYNDNEKLENLLNGMSKEGWDLYSIQELETDGDIFYNCIFIKEVESEEDIFPENSGLFDFKPGIERIINPELAPYDVCVDILKSIKEKRQKISQVKSLIDGTSEDSRGILNEEISRHINELDELKRRLSKVLNPDIMKQRLGEYKLTLSISEELMDITDTKNDDNILSQIVYTRQNLTDESGYILPKVIIELDDTLDENEFVIKIRGIPVVSSHAYCNHTMFLKQELNTDKLPKNAIKSTDALTDIEAIWIPDETAKDYWIKGYGATDYIAAMIEFFVIKYIDDIFDYSDVNRYLEIVGNQNLYLVENIIPDFLSISDIKYLLTSLIKEKVSIKDIVYIFEKINDCVEDESKDDILKHLRIGLSRQITASICNEDNVIQAYEVSDEALKAFDFGDNKEEIVHINTNKMDNFVDKIQNIAENSEYNTRDIVLIVPLKYRHVVYLVLSQLIDNVRVVAKEELSFEYSLQILGRI